ncbi:M23 family metallopeptidase [Clostridium sp. YIM B02515]|uniref:M23 family metallopeptidase n=1 Tax=Clostridium rhizosphaerae TaxID=2803861 RepID=A0ABS1T8V0_9CLOT|nr:M23 family metallopeptidase [Clostridium rhizosphaerae]MBL4935212.1 M23 family metallopeptidase [Clostridium rhizosphaerae]
MGNYNSQYENYYSSLVKKKSYRGYNYANGGRGELNTYGNYFLKRLFRDLIGVFILFIFIIICKLVVTPQTTLIYNYSKTVVNKNYDYNTMINNIKTLDLKKLEDSSTDFLENVKTKLTGIKPLKDRLKNEFQIPVEGNIISSFSNKSNSGIDIGAKNGTEVISPSEGKIKDLGENEQLGKYIVIDHGKGIETKYSSLSEVFIKKDDVIQKGQVIAKTGDVPKSGTPHLHFEVLYMGENKNPEDYISFIGR